MLKLIFIASFLATSLTGSCFAQSPVDIADKPNKVKLTRAVKQKLEQQIIPAIESENPAALVESVLSIIKSSPKQLEAIEEYCKTEAIDSVRTAFTDALLSQIQEGNNVRGAIANIDAVHYIGGDLLAKIQTVIADTSVHAVMKDPLEVSKEFQESEELFWNIHVLHNDLANSKRLVKFSNAIVDEFSKKLQLSDKGREFTTKFSDAKNKLATLTSTVKERSTELRLQRFNQAKNELASKPEFKSRFTAAMSMEIDGEQVIEFLANSKSKKSKALMQPGLVDEIKTVLAKNSSQHGDLAEKARLFRNGLHYWLRGRYGIGPQFYGMLKRPTAMDSQFVMRALYMPRQRPAPISAYHSDGSRTNYDYDRRHLFTWAAEYRPIVGSYRKNGSRNTNVRIESDVKSSNQIFL